MRFASWLNELPFFKKLAFGIATVGGAGLTPRAPGTVGSLVGAIVFLWLGRLSWTFQILFILTLVVLGLWASKVMELETGREDDQRIVIDEVIGMWITVCSFPPSLVWLAIGFVVFRFLDVTKPFPANWVEVRWRGARGVIFDDIVSGIYGQVLLRAIYRVYGLF